MRPTFIMGYTQGTILEDIDFTNKWGDNMAAFAWDGPRNPYYEIPELVKYKTEQEIDLGIKYSKYGIIDFVESYMINESKDCKIDKKNARLWE